MITDKNAYFVTDGHPILVLDTPFKGGLNALEEAKKSLKIGWMVNNYQDWCWE